jgi:hypothetical protein
MPSIGQEEFQWFSTAQYGVEVLKSAESFAGSFWAFLVINDAVVSSIDGATTGNYDGLTLSAGTLIPTPQALNITCVSGVITVLKSK